MIEWEKLQSSCGIMERAKVPGGWFVRSTVQAGNLRGQYSYPPPPGVLASEQTGRFGNEFGGDNFFVTSSMAFYPDPGHTWSGDSL